MPTWFYCMYCGFSFPVTDDQQVITACRGCGEASQFLCRYHATDTSSCTHDWEYVKRCRNCGEIHGGND